MLPPMLDEIKRRLESQSVTMLSNEERRLLEELRFIDRNTTREQVLIENRDWVEKMVSGPGGTCPCCGR